MYRFKQLKEEEKKKKLSKATAVDVETSATVSDSEGKSDEESTSKDDEVLQEAVASSGSKSIPNYTGPRRSKRSKRKRAV